MISLHIMGEVWLYCTFDVLKALSSLFFLQESVCLRCLRRMIRQTPGPRSCHIVLWSWTFQGHYRVDHLGSISVLDTLCFKLSICQTSLLLTRIFPADIAIHSRARVLFNVF